MIVNAPIGVFIINLDRAYGSESSTLRLVNGLAERGQAVDLIVQFADPSVVSIIDPRIRRLEIGSRSPFATLRFLIRYLRQTPPRVLFTRMEKPSLLGLLAGLLTGYRRIVPSVHFNMNAYTQLEYGFRRKILRLLIAVFYRLAPRVVAVSSGAGEALKRWTGPRTRLTVISNGFDLADLRRQTFDFVDFPWLTAKSVPVICACGRLVPLKGFDVLLKAFTRLRAHTPARLIILGEGELSDELPALAHKLGVAEDVAFPGFVSNPAAWFAKSDVYVMTSRTEALPNALVEALAAGTEVISTDCPSGPAEVLEGGKWGQLVPVDDEIALAAALQLALERQRDAATQETLQHYLDRAFSLNTMVEAYLTLLKELDI
ncbi:MAG: glycosyltransferase [Alphaproteobacteria bacterium]|nr:glycosyltransferase [Alphaproteobacteria bacterium]